VKTVTSLKFSSGPRRARLFLLGFLAVLFLVPSFSSRNGLIAAPKSGDRDRDKEKDKDKAKPYAVIAGTVWGPDDRPVYGVPVKIRRASDSPKKARWEVYSDHMGEFAQRVPAGESDYILWTDLKGFKFGDGKPVHLVQQVTVHIYNDEREDTGLHLAH
jgi:hypothetical protein